MSYCRFSSDNWRSDVYVYESRDGWITHVAGNRVVGEIPEEPSFDLLRTDSNRWNVEHRKVMDFLENAERKPIDLPLAGETFRDDSPRACAKTLRRLRDKGFNVPNGVIETLEEESPDTNPDPG